MSLDSFMQEYEERTESEPFMPSHRSYTPGVGSSRRFAPIALFKLESFDGGVRLASIRSFVLGKGDGSQALAWLCDLADRHQVTIRGDLIPDGPGLDESQLRAWCKKYGFVCTNGAMHRQPCPLSVWTFPERKGLFLRRGLNGQAHQPTERWLNSFHEAGHGIVAWSIGTLIKEATVEGTCGYVGYVLMDELQAHEKGLIARGGLLAEVLAFGLEYASERESDVSRVFHDTVALRVGDRDCVQCGQEAGVLHSTEALHRLESHTQELKTLADELFRRGTMTGEEIGELLA